MDTDTAISAANGWALAGRPLVRALFALEDVQCELSQELDKRTWDEARPIITRPQRELREMLEGLRENFICDCLPPHPSSDTSQAEWDAYDEASDAIRNGVLSVDALIKQMAAEV